MTLDLRSPIYVFPFAITPLNINKYKYLRSVKFEIADREEKKIRISKSRVTAYSSIIFQSLALERQDAGPRHCNERCLSTSNRSKSTNFQHHRRKGILFPQPLTQVVADVIRTCLGPKAMLKMLLDPMGGVLITNDGHAILREIDVAHPAAKSMIELSRTQDEEVGDGTTTVIILGNLLVDR
jgi:hypothetical protein